MLLVLVKLRSLVPTLSAALDRIDTSPPLNAPAPEKLIKFKPRFEEPLSKNTPPDEELMFTLGLSRKSESAGEPTSPDPFRFTAVPATILIKFPTTVNPPPETVTGAEWFSVTVGADMPPSSLNVLEVRA